MRVLRFGPAVVGVIICTGYASAQQARGDWIELYLKAADRRYLDYTLTTTCADENFADIVVQADRIATAAKAAGTAREMQKLALRALAEAEAGGNLGRRQQAATDLEAAEEKLARAVANLELQLTRLPECKPGFPYVYRSIAESTLRELVAKIQSSEGVPADGTFLAPDAPIDATPEMRR